MATDDGLDEKFLKPINDASKEKVSGFLDELLVMADASVDGEYDPEAAAARKHAQQVAERG
jgi:hypothetical protein